MNDQNHNHQPIRHYRKTKGNDMTRTVVLFVMLGIILIGLVVFIMSLTGTGLFADPVPDVITDETSDDSSEGDGTEDGDTQQGDESEEDTAHGFDDEVIYSDGYNNLMDVDGIHEGDLLLIDATHPFVCAHPMAYAIYDYKTPSYTVATADIRLKTSVTYELNKLMDAFAAAENFTQTRVRTGYRSYRDQKTLYDNDKSDPKKAAAPGCSDYHNGATIYIDRYAPETKLVYELSGLSQSLWLKEHSHEYGFTFRYPVGKKDITGYEIPWQMRYVGVPHATYMYEKFYCLEEYLEDLENNYRFGEEHLRVTCADGKVYEIYYVPALAEEDVVTTEGTVTQPPSVTETEAETEAPPVLVEGKLPVPVPENREYTISGDNRRGFIVTVLVDVLS